MFPELESVKLSGLSPPGGAPGPEPLELQKPETSLLLLSSEFVSPVELVLYDLVSGGGCPLPQNPDTSLS